MAMEPFEYMPMRFGAHDALKVWLIKLDQHQTPAVRKLKVVPLSLQHLIAFPLFLFTFSPSHWSKKKCYKPLISTNYFSCTNALVQYIYNFISLNAFNELHHDWLQLLETKHSFHIEHAWRAITNLRFHIEKTSELYNEWAKIQSDV